MEAPVFRSWRCPKLHIEHPTHPFKAPGTVELRADGNLDISVEANPFGGLDYEDVTITGATDGGDTVVAHRAFSHTQSMSLAPSGITGVTRFGAFNCEIRAPGYDAAGVTAQVFYLRNATFHPGGKFSRGGSEVSLRGIGGRPEPGHVSATLRIEHVGEHDRIAYEQLRSLLRLAQRSLVLAPCQEDFVGTTLARTVLRPDTRTTAVRLPLISWFGDRTARFLESTLTAYLATETLYDLESMIQYYVLAHTSDVQELQFMFASVFMEGLKFNWAKNVSTLQPDVKANGVIRGFRTGPGQKNLSFEELMKRLAAHLGYGANFTFVEDRNVIFHTGHSSARQLGVADPYAVLHGELLTLYDQMDDLLLRLLGYSGVIYSPRDPDQALDFPARTASAHTP